MNKIILLFLCNYITFNWALNDVEKAFQENMVVPDVISESPKESLIIKYENSNKTVELGKELEPKDVKEQPNIIYNGDTDENTFYTLIMTDPDAPSRQNPKIKEWNHWLIVNIPGGSHIDKGEILSEYVGAGPPKNTGLHRYIFLLYKQFGGKIDFTETIHKNTDPNRGHFSTKQFVDKYKLQLVAGNFFQAQFDNYVLELHRQFKNK